MTTTTSTTTFNFRTKFKKLITPEEMPDVNRAFEYFCNLSACEAIKILWGLTYSSRSSTTVLQKLGLDSFVSYPEKIIVFRNELRFQYEEQHPDFFKPSMDSEFELTYSTLLSKSDKVVANIVFEHCSLALNKSGFKNIERILFLLKSETESNYFGGIRSLYFKVEEAEYLKPFHLEIYNMLKVMYEYIPFYFEEENKEEYDEEKNHLLENIEEEIEEVKDKELDKLNQQYKKITAEKILKNMENFKKFAESDDLNMLISIAQLGFDLNEVMDKKEGIFNFIKAVEDLNF